MKKKLMAALTAILVFAAIIIAYKFMATDDMKTKTYDFLATKGYTEQDISEIEVKHSFVNKLLGYNEWRIFVEFASEPDIIFAFTYRNEEIIKQGVTSSDLLDKDEILEYDAKFHNGQLKN